MWVPWKVEFFALTFQYFTVCWDRCGGQPSHLLEFGRISVWCFFFLKSSLVLNQSLLTQNSSLRTQEFLMVFAVNCSFKKDRPSGDRELFSFSDLNPVFMFIQSLNIPRFLQRSGLWWTAVVLRLQTDACNTFSQTVFLSNLLPQLL